MKNNCGNKAIIQCNNINNNFNKQINSSNNKCIPLNNNMTPIQVAMKMK